MMISTKGRYALRILVDIAEHQGDGYVPLKESADRQEISEKYLESIVSTLVKYDFIEGLRGKGGGYKLGRPAEQIVIYDVLDAMEGTLVPVACLEKRAKPCARTTVCQTLPLWNGQGLSEPLHREGPDEPGKGLHGIVLHLVNDQLSDRIGEIRKVADADKVLSVYHSG